MAHQAFIMTSCVAAILVVMAPCHVTSVSIWSLLGDRLKNDGSLLKRELSSQMLDHEHGVVMGVPNQECDDGEHGIATDWDGLNTTVTECVQTERDNLKTNSDPVILEEKELESRHVCLNESIDYGKDLPLNGPHRPLWPKFGEYKYLPPQRWVHSLEHGAVVLLYHPCSSSSELESLKSELKGCLTKYIIAPYRKIPHRMPFALLAFTNARLISNANDMAGVKNFIRNFGLLGPETRVLKDGQYDIGLIAGVDKEVTNENNCKE